MDVAMDAGKGYNISMNQDKRHKISTREVRFALDEITDIRKKLSEAMEYLLSRKKLDDIPDINGLKNHDIEITRRIYETFLKQRGADIRSEIMWFSIEIAVRGGSDMVIQWMLGNIDLPAEKMARLICETLPEEIKKYQMSPVTHV